MDTDSPASPPLHSTGCFPPSSAPSSPPPPAKRQKSCSTKVCIICTYISNSPDVKGYDYNVYVVDADADTDADDGLMPKKLTLRVEGFQEIGVWVLNSTLYIFEGFVDKKYYVSNKSAYKYKLDLSGCDMVLKRSEVEQHAQKLPEMLRSKSLPIAVATPDGEKILVFSAEAQRLDSDWGCIYDFEIFDVKTESWKTLPGISGGDDMEFINAYGFASNSVFLVDVCGGVYALDLESPDQNPWGTYKFSPFVPHVGPFLVIEEELYITSCVATDMANARGSHFHFRRPSFGAAQSNVNPDSSSNCISLLSHVKDKECSFCILSIANTFRGGTHCLAMDAYNCDILQYRAHKEKCRDGARPTPTILKSFKYVLDCDFGGILNIVTVIPI